MLSSTSSEIKAIRILLLGDNIVGKTAIIHSILNLEFTESIMPTLGIERFQTKFTLKNGNIIKISFNDTAGGERFRSVELKKLQYSDCIVLVFDVTNRKSFENINKRIEDVNNNSNNLPLVLFGNKIDEKRKVTSEEAKNFAEKMKIAYFETSAKTKEGINEGFSYIVNETYEKLEKKIENNIKLEEKNIEEDKTKCVGKNKNIKKNQKKK